MRTELPGAIVLAGGRRLARPGCASVWRVVSEEPSIPGPAAGGFVGRHAWAPYLLLTMTMLFFAGNIIVARAVSLEFPPMGLVFWRCVVGVILILPFVYGRLRAQASMVLRQWKLMLALGTTQAVIGQGLLYLGVHSTTAINGGLISSTQAAFTIFVAWLLLRDTITLRQAVGLVVAMVGVAAIIARGSLAALLSLEFVIGDIWVQVATLSFALYNVLVKRIAPGLNPFVAFLAMTLAAAAVSLPLHVGELAFTDSRMEFNLATVASVLYIAVFASILALVFLNVGIAQVGPGKAGMLFNLVPVFTAVLAIAMLGESLRTFHLVGIALVFLGVYLTTRPSARDGGRPATVAQPGEHR